MTLLKKIFILVNLILCIFCINVFSVIYWSDFANEAISSSVNILSKHQGEYVIGFQDGYKGSPLVIIASNSPMILVDNTLYFIAPKYCTNVYWNTSTSNTVKYTKYSYTSSTNAWNEGVEGSYNWLSFPQIDQISDSTTNFGISDTTVFYTNYDIYRGTQIGNVREEGSIQISDEIWAESYDKNNIMPDIPDIDDSLIDWEGAFDFYVGSYSVENHDGKAYEYAGHNYSDNLNLFWVLNSLEDTISPSKTQEFGFTYFLESNLEFIFTDFKGEKHSEIIRTTHIFNDSIFVFELPYLVRNDELGKNEEYSPFLMALEFYLGPFTGNYENWEAWFYECVECYVDSQGYFDYEIILHSKVYKMYDYDISTKEEIYTYADIPISYDMNSSLFVVAKDSPSIFYPYADNKDIYYLVDPDGKIITGTDNSDRYDFDDDWTVIDTWGEKPPIQPVINETTGDLEMKDPNGNVTNRLPIGDNRPKPEEIIENIDTIGGFSLNGILEDLTNNLNDLFVNNDSLSKMLEWFRSIFGWLPFDLLKIFGTLIFLALIFIFFKLISR